MRNGVKPATNSTPYIVIIHKMKRIIIITVLSLFPFVCNAQNDYGLYVRHPHLGNMDASYQFFYSFGYFTYCTDEYNDLTGHICISGNFKIQNDLNNTQYSLSP